MANDRAHQQGEKELARRQGEQDKGAVQNQTERAQNPILRLQRQLGNAQVSRILTQGKQAAASLQRQPGEEEEEGMAQAMHDPSVQRQPGEEEEEGMAQAMHDPSVQRQPGEEEEEGMAQATPEVGLAGGPISSDLASRIQTKRGTGSQLDSGIRGSMEAAFDTSFEGVRVHSDNESQNINHQISSKAFTTGNDIFLGKQASSNDSQLMAHELTHVVQQRSIDTSGPMTVSPAGDKHEQQADAVAAAIGTGPSKNVDQRQADE